LPVTRARAGSPRPGNDNGHGRDHSVAEFGALAVTDARPNGSAPSGSVRASSCSCSPQGWWPGTVGYMLPGAAAGSGFSAAGPWRYALRCVRVVRGLTAVACECGPLRLLRMVQTPWRSPGTSRIAHLALARDHDVGRPRPWTTPSLPAGAGRSHQAVLAARVGRGAISFSAGDVLEFRPHRVAGLRVSGVPPLRAARGRLSADADDARQSPTPSRAC
jgi:hypothetical protein